MLINVSKSPRESPRGFSLRSHPTHYEVLGGDVVRMPPFSPNHELDKVSSVKQVRLQEGVVMVDPSRVSDELAELIVQVPSSQNEIVVTPEHRPIIALAPPFDLDLPH